MSRVMFHSKAGTMEVLPAIAGQLLADALHAAGIPVNAVLTRRNGSIVPEESTVVGPDDLIEVTQVRHYDLDVTRRPARRVEGVADPVYSKAVLFDHNGTLESRCEQFDEAGFVHYVEETFVQSVVLAELLRPGDEVVVGLSGGRDSVAFLKLLERTGGRLPTFPMTAVTVTGLPDWEEPATFETAKTICRDLGIEQVVVGADEIERTFQLDRPFVEVMHHIATGESRHLTMVVGHQVLRRMLEKVAEQKGAAAVAFGFNADDLVASLVTWFTSGFRMGGIPVRHLGPIRHVFPLYRVTKKELTLYLEFVAVELSRQGAPGQFTTGPDERSMAYAVTDWLYDLWPGIDYYVFASFANTQRYSFPMVEQVCRTCGGIYVLQEGLPNPPDRCDVCELLRRHGFAVVD
jgi:tRNA(Ile)-lysidine synthase TilS/MesJ